jgi:hypothetical protein
VRGRTVTVADFSGGVDLQAAPYHLKDNQARDARDVRSTVRGALRKRDGTTTFAGGLGRIPDAMFAAQAPTFLLLSESDRVQSVSPAGVIADVMTGLTSSVRMGFVQAPASGGQGPIYMMNGVGAWYWTGAGAGQIWTAATGTLPIGRFLVYHGNRVWAAGMTSLAGVTDPASTLAFSNLANPRDWPAANVVQFDPGDKEGIQAIAVVGSSLLVAKPSKLWVVYDLDTGANRRLSDNVGCVAHRSMVATQHGTFFLSRDQGVMLTDGSTLKRVSDPVLPILETIPAAQRQLAAGVFFQGHYLLCIPESGTANTVMLDYDVERNAWWLHSLPMTALAVWEPVADAQLFGARPTGASTARIDRLFVPGVAQDAGASFRSYWRSRFFTFGAVPTRKRIHAIMFEGKGAISVGVGKDFGLGYLAGGGATFGADAGTYGGAGAYGGAGSFGGDREIGDARILTPGVARTWGLELSNQSNADMEVEAITFMLDFRKD